MYKITNIAKDKRKFMDSYLGKYIVLNPGENTLVKKAPKEHEFFQIENLEKKEKKDLIKLKEVKQDDSRYNR